jgi:hypothetical protein
MSISDGFELWIGKALAEIAIFFAVLLVIMLGALALVGVGKLMDWRQKRRARPTPAEPR